MKQVIIATKNEGKVNEFRNFFSPYGISVLSLRDVDASIEIEETGTTFEENALIKARFLAQRLKQDVLADDSGLEVMALNNEPGVYSARYSGEEKNDQANNQKLLANLKGITDRQARFVCALAYVTADQEETVVRGTCEGVILESERGTNGFGYDPLFYLPSYNKTFAELTKDEKQKVSHRGSALKQLKSVMFGDLNG